MLNIIDAITNYLSIGHSNDPIKQYCQTEFKKDWKEQYYKLTGRIIN